MMSCSSGSSVYSLISSSKSAHAQGGTSWADEELEYASSGGLMETSGGDEDGGADLGGAGPQQPGRLPPAPTADKRNLAALARSGRLPRFHYNKKLGPAASPLQPSRVYMAGRRLLPAVGGAAMPPMLRQHQGGAMHGWRSDASTAAGDQALQGDAPEKMGVVEALGRLSEAAIFPYIGPHRWIKPWCIHPADLSCLYPAPMPQHPVDRTVLHPLPSLRSARHS
ncbi:hypothetical protein HPB50_012506 [Hyalomma asiaticum]|uniref:Uncharacterized protein n=1 Tax=Hyalomma asiaticum TaxID=266040 RepID=A0ACB7SF14_HYAAI|nr:hypothetical protein HPB50_012506 [Hyalomma asiaticum]